MIELERHIEILLLNNDCVIVPELGGFMAHHVEACYNEDEQLFLPPQRTIGFNPQLKMNDSLLAQSYVEAYDLSYPEALRRVEEEVTELKQHLESKGSYEMDDIGTLSLNEDGVYIFSPCKAGILTPELYGLSSFEMNRPTIDHVLSTQEEKVDAKPLDEKSTTTTSRLEDIIINGEEDEERTIEIKMSWIQNTIAIAAAVLLFFFMTTPVSNSEPDNIRMGKLNNPLVANGFPKDTSAKDIEVKRDVISETADKEERTTQTVPTKTQEKPVVSKEVTESYCIVMASYVSIKNSEYFVRTLHQKGFQDARIYMSHDVRRVIYGNYPTETDAYNQLRSLRNQKDFEDAWILKIKNNN